MKKKINRYVYTFNSNPQDQQLEKYLASVIKDFDVPIGLIFIKEAKIILSQDSFKTPLNGSLLQGNLYSCGINLAAVPYFKNSIYEPMIFADPTICG